MALYKTFKSMNGGENKEENNYQVLNINTTQERLNHIGSHKIIVINYHTDWCGPCNQVPVNMQNWHRSIQNLDFVCY